MHRFFSKIVSFSVVFSSFLLTTTGCAPKVHLRVLEPSEIFVPQHVEQLAFVDRSEAKNLGQGVLGVVEGLVTGEEIGQDAGGRDAAGTAMRRILVESPRFEMVEPGQIEVDSSLFDKQMSWDAAHRICKAAGCQGIVALEAFDSDSSIDSREEQYKESEDGKEVTKKRWHASRQTNVLTAWRLYDVENRKVIDQLRDHASSQTWEHTAPTEDEAISNLPSQSQSVRDMGARAGDHYGRRIAPSYITVTRAIYVRGDDRLKAQKNKAKSGQLKEAEGAWKKVWKSGASDKIKARAAYNLAVSKEVEGDLDAAVEWARKAAVKWPKGRIGSYVYTLEQRQQKAAKLREQMGEPEPAPETEPAPPPAAPAEPPPPTAPPKAPPAPSEPPK